MPTDAPVDERNLDGYEAPLIDWTRARDALEGGLSHQAPETGGPNRHTPWLATLNPDGTPHVMPVGVMLVDGSLYFTSGAGTRKAKNLAKNPHCAITVATYPFDLVMEGEAVRVTDDAKLQRIAHVFSSQGWQRRFVTAPSMPSSARRAPARPRGTCTR